MPFKPSDRTRERLQSWIVPESWYSSHALDDDRFYSFVLHCWADDPGIWDEKAVREKILQAVNEFHPGFDEGEAAAIVHSRVEEGTIILDFLSHTKQRNELNMLEGDDRNPISI